MVERGGLENRCAFKAYRGFESHLLRHSYKIGPCALSYKNGCVKVSPNPRSTKIGVRADRREATRVSAIIPPPPPPAVARSAMAWCRDVAKAKANESGVGLHVFCLFYSKYP